jgi:hypothetical protein
MLGVEAKLVGFIHMDNYVIAVAEVTGDNICWKS